MSAPASVGEVKKAVRKRDGMCCTVCGMSQEECLRTFGRRLHVHRKIPGSPYTVDGCVSLCRNCHMIAHGCEPPFRLSPPRPPVPGHGDIPVQLYVDASLKNIFEALAKLHGRSLSDEVRHAMLRHRETPPRIEMVAHVPALPDAVVRVEEKPPPKPKRPRGRPRKQGDG